MDDYVASNDHGTAVVLRVAAAAGVRRLVQASSMVVYGEGRYDCPRHGPVPPAPRAREALERGMFEPACPACGAELRPGLVTEDARLDPRNDVRGHQGRPGAPGRGLVARDRRPRRSPSGCHNVYGPGMPRNTPYAGVAAVFSSALDRGEAPRVFEDGRQRRDFVHVGDVAAAFATCLAATASLPPGHRAYNVGSRRRQHGRRHGAGAVRVARRTGPRRHRRLPPGRRPPHHRLQRAAAPRAGLARKGFPSRGGPRAAARLGRSGRQADVEAAAAADVGDGEAAGVGLHHPPGDGRAPGRHPRRRCRARAGPASRCRTPGRGRGRRCHRTRRSRSPAPARPGRAGPRPAPCRRPACAAPRCRPGWTGPGPARRCCPGPPAGPPPPRRRPRARPRVGGRSRGPHRRRRAPPRPG